MPVLRTKVGRTLQKKRTAALGVAQEETLKELQDEVFHGGLVTVRDMLNFREVDPSKSFKANPDNGVEQDPIFVEWCAEFGEEEALKRYRVAAASWAPDKETPMAIKEAAKLTVGIMKARAVEKGGTRVLNVGTVNMSADIPKLPEVEIE
jgi:hypothetical protein